MDIKNWRTGEVMASGNTLNEAIDSIRNADGEADLRFADLRNADLRNADLRNADLRNADLIAADLIAADLRNADLRAADLRAADLRNADLRNADLIAADLIAADLSSANLRSADLSDADLSSANLRAADLSDADLSSANLRAADLSDETKIDDLNAAKLSILPEGELICYKKAWTHHDGYPNNPVIVRLRIPADAKRSNATGRKCRCDKAEVLSMTTPTGEPCTERVFSSQDPDFEYEVGKTVSVPDFDENRWKECAPGIHFFITRVEALNY